MNERDAIAFLLHDEPHVVHLRSDGYTLRHPLSCRPQLFDCPVEAACSAWDARPAPNGYYKVTATDGYAVVGTAVEPYDAVDWTDVLLRLADRAAEAQDLVEGVIAQACQCDDGTIDSGALGYYADAMHWLADRGRIAVTYDAGRRVIGSWVEGTERPWNADAAVIDAAHLTRQRSWSADTFGPGRRTLGVLDHIRKELAEIEADPDDLSEWVDVVILALDGAWRHGWEPQQIIDAIIDKQARNEARTWPDWRTMSADHAIEHDRTRKGR